MPPPPSTVGDGGVLQKMKMGAMMGGTVGLTIGFIFGSFSILRGGPGPRGALATLSQYMLSSAATFGFFMSIGSVIRTDSPYSNPSLYNPSAYINRPHLNPNGQQHSVYSKTLGERYRFLEAVRGKSGRGEEVVVMGQ